MKQIAYGIYDSPNLMWSERLSARTLDACGALSDSVLSEIHAQFLCFGALHVKNTGLRSRDELISVLNPLGFSQEESFCLGGRTSDSWQQKWVEPDRLRRLDYYPPSMYLLPNNEVQYQRRGPLHVLFYCQAPPFEGGRCFLHSAAALERELRASALGSALLDRIQAHGLTIETGFLDRSHTQKTNNYFQSWQERFETDDPICALARAQEKRDEYDLCWWREEEGEPPTLMTRITRSGMQRHPFDQKLYLRFPRIAFDAPSARNGFRCFPLGDGSELTEAERALLRSIFLATREGTTLAPGDLILFDNVRYAHSRESFVGDREVYVAMAGEVHEETPVSTPSIAPWVQYTTPTQSQCYNIPKMWAERFSCRTFSVGALTPDIIVSIREQFDRYGVLLLQDTGLHELTEETLQLLGFGLDESFPWGGMRSGRTTRRVLSPTLRATDDYPPELWLLPHNEVIYQREIPAKLLFFSTQDADIRFGGRTFVHSSRAMIEWLQGRGKPGKMLLASLREHGLMIEMGFVDEHHPARAKNYFRSWQERFDTTSRDEALARCLASTSQFDEAWWREDTLPDGRLFYTLMTRIRLSAFYDDQIRKEEYLLFPRIALDAPQHHNGYRVYPKGNGEPFSSEEIDLLLGAFLATREGVHYRAGDILLVDNLRYGHSRESFQGLRSIGVSMAGKVVL